MKSKLDKALSLVALGVIGVLQSAQAAPVYEVVNIEDYDLNGTLEGTRLGYAFGVNANDELVGVAKGKKKLTSSDAESDIIDIEDGITESETITYSITSAIVANNYAFVAAQNSSAGAWVPTFESINGTTDPSDMTAEQVNSVDSFYYGINDAGIKVGSMTAPEQKVVNTSTTDDAEDFWYFRDYELRAVAMDGNTEIPLPPPYTQYVDDDGKTVELGGWSEATAVNNSNLIVGYASTGLSKYGKERANACLNSDALPLEVCIQREQYPNTAGARNIQYQTRAYVWQLNNDVPAPTELPLGLEPGDSTYVFTAQALGVSDNGVVAGRSHVYRNGNTKKLAQDAAYWMKDADGNYKYHWIPMEDDIYSSVAYDVNDSGIVVGSYRSYLQGYLRDKFFYFDSNNPDATYVTPNDFATKLTDLSSKPKDINNQGQVVGNIETTYDKEKKRPKAGFLFDKSTAEFSNLNDLLTCESKGFEKNADGTWSRHKVAIQDGSGKTLSYEANIVIADATSINEAGTIVGTALVRKPSYQLDDDGNVVTNNGKPLFELNGAGEPVTSYVARMVVLKPTSSGEACTVEDSIDAGDYERKGAASLAWLLALPLVWLRRRVRSI